MALALSITPRQSTDDWMDWRTAVREHPNAEDPFARDIVATSAGSDAFTFSRELSSRDYNALQEIAPFEYAPAALDPSARGQKQKQKHQQHQSSGDHQHQGHHGRTRLAVWMQRTTRQTKRLLGCSAASSASCAWWWWWWSCCDSPCCTWGIDEDGREEGLDSSRTDLFGSSQSRRVKPNTGKSMSQVRRCFQLASGTQTLLTQTVPQMVYPMESFELKDSSPSLLASSSRTRGGGR